MRQPENAKQHFGDRLGQQHAIISKRFIYMRCTLLVVSCVELFNGHVYGREFTITNMRIDSSIIHVRKCIEKIRDTKNRKAFEKDPTAVYKYLTEFTLSHPRSGKSTDMIGLVGEIVCETYHEKCKQQTLFYAKWRETGSSKSNGIDLIFEEANKLLVVECKHIHSRQSANKKSRLLESIRAGIVEHSGHQASVFLAARHRVLSKRIRELGAEGSDTSETQQKISVIKKALSGGFDSQVDLVVDRERGGVGDYAMFGSKSSKIWPANERSRALLLLVDELYAITEAA